MAIMAMNASRRLLSKPWLWDGQKADGSYRLHCTTGSTGYGDIKAHIGSFYSLLEHGTDYRVMIGAIKIDKNFETLLEAQEFCETFFKLKGEM